MDIVARSKWFTIVQANETDEVITCADEVLIVARDDEGRILLIEEPAYAFGGNALLLPCGSIDAEEKILAAAQRELREETGFGARDLRLIGALRPWSKYLQVTSHIVLAAELFAAPLKGDEAHAICVHLMTASEALAMVRAGEIVDARVIAALSLCGLTGKMV